MQLLIITVFHNDAAVEQASSLLMNEEGRKIHGSISDIEETAEEDIYY